MKLSLNSGCLNGMSRATKAFFCLRVSLLGMLVLAGMLSATASHAAPDYTSNPRYGGSPRIVSVWVDPNFTDPERGQVLSAIEEWNAALNGVARIDVVASSGGQSARGETWLIRRGPGKEGVREEGRTAQSFGTVQAMPLGGWGSACLPASNRAPAAVFAEPARRHDARTRAPRGAAAP